MRAIEYFELGRPMLGESASGDMGVVADFDGGTLVAAIDGLGHGKEAMLAASLAKRVLEENAGERVDDLIRLCHAELKQTRGAVATLARLETATNVLSWGGVGNVEGVLCHRGADGETVKESVILAGGIIGYRLPTLHIVSVHISPGDLLILATDGITPASGDSFSRDDELARIAEGLLENFGKTTDDALVVAARFLGA